MRSTKLHKLAFNGQHRLDRTRKCVYIEKIQHKNPKIGTNAVQCGYKVYLKKEKHPKVWRKILGIASHLYSDGPIGRQKQKQTLLQAANAANATNSSPVLRGLHEKK